MNRRIPIPYPVYFYNGLAKNVLCEFTAVPPLLGFHARNDVRLPHNLGFVRNEVKLQHDVGFVRDDVKLRYWLTRPQ